MKSLQAPLKSVSAFDHRPWWCNQFLFILVAIFPVATIYCVSIQLEILLKETGSLWLFSVLWAAIWLGGCFFAFILFEAKFDEIRRISYCQYLAGFDADLLIRAVASMELDSDTRAHVRGYLNAHFPGWSFQ